MSDGTPFGPNEAQRLVDAFLESAVQISDVAAVAYTVPVSPAEAAPAVLILPMDDGRVVGAGWVLVDPQPGCADAIDRAITMVQAETVADPRLLSGDGLADALADRASQQPVCVGPCGRRLFGRMADRGACLGCFPDDLEAEAAVLRAADS